MIDLNSKSAVSDRITYLIDERIDLTTKAEQKRDYLGASVIGHQCERYVQFHYLCARGELERTSPEPRVMRIFDRGNVYEEKARRWLKDAGFIFATKLGNKFSAHGGKFRGHVDGVIGGWKRRDIDCPVVLPVLWECKCLGEKGFKTLKKDRLKSFSSTYYAQVQIYMKHLGLKRCLFTAISANTMEFYHQLVDFDANEAALCDARVSTIIEATADGRMVSRCTSKPEFYLCKWCDFSEECWNDN